MLLYTCTCTPVHQENVLEIMTLIMKNYISKQIIITKINQEV